MRTLTELGNLTGRAAVVVGGAGHVGRAAAEALAESGARLALVDVDREGCERAAAAARAVAIEADVADETEARAAIHRASDALGGLDVLVHAAALVGTSRLDGWTVPFAEQSVAAWETALRVNATSAFALVQEAAPLLSASGHGSVVLVSSIYGVVAPDFALYQGTAVANPAAYGASKAALVQLTRYLATALAPRARVNAISPGGILRGQPEQFRQRYEARTPLRRMATEEDMKGAIAYLASDLSAYVTGQNLLVDGGWTVW